MIDEGGGLQRSAGIDDLLTGKILLAGDQPVVAFGQRPAGPVPLVEVVVRLEQAAVLLLLIGPTHFLAEEPAHAAQQTGLPQVVRNALPEKLDALHHPGIAVVVVVEFNRNIVREVVRLKVPDRIKVGLQFGHLLEHRREIRPVLDLFVVVGPIPEECHSDILEAQRCQSHRLAGRIHLAEIGLRQSELFPEFGKLPPLARRVGRLAQGGERHQKHGDSHECQERARP